MGGIAIAVMNCWENLNSYVERVLELESSQVFQGSCIDFSREYEKIVSVEMVYGIRG